MFKRSLLHGGFAIVLLSLPSSLRAQDEVVVAPDANSPEPIGYLLGHSIGGQLRQNGFQVGDFEIQALIAGINDGLQDKEFALSDEILRAAESKIQAMLQIRMQEMSARQKERGAKFLAENAKQQGVKVLDGGVQYKVLTAGSGASPGATDTVSVHYTGKLINGEVFDSSVQRGQPATFPVNGVIQGWQMALQKMKVGDKWMLYIPSDLAYAERGSPGAIGPHEVLVFEVELLGIE
jgi:FKBP-type peptidyl-prolyl cis-trans isomerase FklB